METRAEIRLPTAELRNDLPFYTKVLGMRLDPKNLHPFKGNVDVPKLDRPMAQRMAVLGLAIKLPEDGVECPRRRTRH